MRVFSLIKSWEDPRDSQVREQVAERALATLNGAIRNAHIEARLEALRKLDDSLPALAQQLMQEAKGYGIDLGLVVRREHDAAGGHSFEARVNLSSSLQPFPEETP